MLQRMQVVLMRLYLESHAGFGATLYTFLLEGSIIAKIITKVETMRHIDNRYSTRP